MAIVLDEPLWPDVEYNESKYGRTPVSWEEEDAWFQQLFVGQMPVELKGFVLRFPMGDGYAFYRIEEAEPLTLRWIPYGDQWRLPEAYERGLELSDVEGQVEYVRAMAKGKP